MFCHHCKKEIPVLDRVGRRDTCPHCGRDAHVCLNCDHYDPKSYNECRENQADRVLDKDRSNFCDYFSFAKGGQSGSGSDPQAEAKKKLEALFSKK